ncbi:hypothetical protein KC360_g8604 [Hortaea werneckii]|nr:hypothetical protein KC325_g5065 [Hortaea werneckii]KAI6994939.1 hypothetical protein KC359_g4370 [Hortaea werneckii]KAI7140540.1 hypothetical protein KC344_g8647 [Hortaea werneckii]KAI7167506.1 hypothetical protein KC360_g8604 [Hortaea werneckii]
MPEPEYVDDRQHIIPANASYLRDVLREHNGRTEDQVEEELRQEASALGVDVSILGAQQQRQHQQQQEEGEESSTQQQPSHQPGRAFSSDLPRQSLESLASRFSQSTTLTSNFSDLSRDPQHAANGRGRSRASLSFKDYDAFISKGVPNGRHSLSFSSPPSTPSQSTFSLPLSSPASSPRRHFRRIRGLSMLRLNRSGSTTSLNDSCPHCPQDQASQRRAVHKLPCGHRLCTQALRNTIKSATESKKGAVPSCCGRPIPGKLVEHVMTQAEQHALLEKLEQWDEASSIAASTTSERRTSVASRRPGALSAESRTASDDSRVDTVAPKLQQELDRVMERADFKQLRQDQAEQRDLFLAWIERQRAELDIHHSHLRQEMRARQEQAMEELSDVHVAAMADAEDKQVKAEADMREAHAKERQDTATALKHMEAYCAGTYSTGDAHYRVVTDQDRSELDKVKRSRDQMDIKHESAINVLRGEQSRRLKYRAQRQDREMQELRRIHRREEAEVERGLAEQAHRLDDLVAEKRVSLRARWQVQAAIIVKKFERDTGTSVHARLPSVEWQEGTVEKAVKPKAPNGFANCFSTHYDRQENGKPGVSTGWFVRGRPQRTW